MRVVLQACSQSSLTKAIKALEDSQAVESAPLLLAALERCKGLEAHVRDTLRLRLNMAAGQLGEAARDALELARREQVGRDSTFLACSHDCKLLQLQLDSFRGRRLGNVDGSLQGC